MEVIALTYPLAHTVRVPEECVLVLGFFDGVHLGHQSVIAKGKQLAQQTNRQLVLMSFDKHPLEVFKPNEPVHYLTPMSLKEQVLSDLGVDIFYVLSFTRDVANLSPAQFVKSYIEPLHAKVVVTGFDYRFGHQASGDPVLLSQLGQGQFDVVVVDKETADDEKISSTAIRHALQQGDLDTVNRHLNRPYETCGVVVHGNARGRTIGFPTANIETVNQLLPQESIYVVSIYVGNQWYKGMASIGRNITFEANRPVTVEVHILDFDAEIYGEYVRVKWLKKLREEIKFDGISGLVAQLEKDKQDTLEYFKK